MCGISGIFGLEGLSDTDTIIRSMNAALAHRGPDAEGHWIGKNLALAHRRLAIIDLSDEGIQPMSNADHSVTLVFNGEIYNYLEIKEELKDYPFRTRTDTEVIIAAWKTWGVKCLQKFNGMFAFALWDEQKQTLFIARDRMGIKPLYYTYQGQSILFASEIRSLLASNLVPRKMDQNALVDYLRYQTVHAPQTILKDVLVLEPGHYMLIQDDDVQMHCYWDASRDYDRSALSLSRSDVKTKIRELLADSVSLRMRADVPFGAFLSGGIDSSSIVALMSESSKLAVKTFTVSFNEQDYSEAEFAGLIAKKFNTDHTDIRLNADDFLNTLPAALQAMDHPSGDGPNTFVVSKVTREAGVTMALSGLGGDELFAGYPVFKRSVDLLDKKWLMTFPKPLRNFGTTMLKTAKPGAASEKIAALLNQDYLDLEYSYPLSRQTLLDSHISRLLNTNELPVNAVQEILKNETSFGQSGFELPFLSRISHAEIRSYMQNVLLRDTDQMSMANALEVRVPFLDHRLVSFVYGVADQLKYPHTPKQLLVESMGNLLPEEVVNRPKMGFTFPWSIWMRNELKHLCTEALTKLADHPAFNKTEINKLWDAFLKGDPRYTWSRVWHLVVLADWLEKNGIE